MSFCLFTAANSKGHSNDSSVKTHPGKTLSTVKDEYEDKEEEEDEEEEDFTAHAKRRGTHHFEHADGDYSLEHFNMLKVLGRGAYGKVCFQDQVNFLNVTAALISFLRLIIVTTIFSVIT